MKVNDKINRKNKQVTNYYNVKKKKKSVALLCITYNNLEDKIKERPYCIIVTQFLVIS